MKIAIVPAAFAFALLTAASALPASAAGCVSGGAVGGLVGHEADGHGVAGAAVGCAVGHHEANKKIAQSSGTAPNAGTGSTAGGTTSSSTPTQANTNSKPAQQN